VLHLVTRKTVPVEFRDVPPNRNIDTSRFKPQPFADMKAHGLKIRFLAVMQAAAVHYQSRFRHSRASRFANAFLELMPVVDPGNPTGGLRLRDAQSSEFQTRSSEVLGVGLCVLAATQLFGVNRNRIEPIETSGKRCDFRVVLGGTSCNFEAKARQHTGHLSSAIDDVFDKKSAKPDTPAYGFVSHVPRNDGETSMIVVDPQRDDPRVTRPERIAAILRHYVRVVTLAGFWRLADALNERVAALEGAIAVQRLDGERLEFGSVAKMGRSYRVETRSGEFEFFAASDSELGLNLGWEHLRFVLAIDPKIYEILVAQDFDALERYSLQSADGSDELTPRPFAHTVLADGSALIGIPSDAL
jgi:hypothetical protein